MNQIIEGNENGNILSIRITKHLKIKIIIVRVICYLTILD